MYVSLLLDGRVMDQKILNIAHKQLSCGGYAELNFGKISKELGITRANIHYHFENKLKLAFAVLDKYFSDMEAMLAQSIKACNGDFVQFVERLDEMVWVQMEASGFEGVCPCAALMNHAAGLPEELHAKAKLMMDRKFDAIESLIETWVEKKGKRLKLSPREVAVEFNLMVIGNYESARSYGPDERRNSMFKNALSRWVNNL